MEQKVVTLDSLLKVLHVDRKLSSADEVREAEKLIGDVLRMSPAAIDCIYALFERGPLYDGDVPSKSGRDMLLHGSFAAKIVMNGEEGYNACTYKGASAYRLLDSGARSMPLTDKETVVCDKCNGTGRRNGLYCHACHDDGRIPTLGMGNVAMFQIWAEGFETPDQSARATFQGLYRGDTFIEAVLAFKKTFSPNQSSAVDLEKLTLWGSRLFDNEADARRAFG